MPVPLTRVSRVYALCGYIDRFGRDVTATPADEGWTRVAVTAMESPVLFGWLAQFGDAVVVEKPTALARAYAAHLRAILDAHGLAEEDGAPDDKAADAPGAPAGHDEEGGAA